jgi:hypothetical protein
VASTGSRCPADSHLGSAVSSHCHSGKFAAVGQCCIDTANRVGSQKDRIL